MNQRAKNKEKYVFDPEAHLKKIEAYFNGPPPWRYEKWFEGLKPVNIGPPGGKEFLSSPIPYIRGFFMKEGREDIFVTVHETLRENYYLRYQDSMISINLIAYTPVVQVTGNIIVGKDTHNPTLLGPYCKIVNSGDKKKNLKSLNSLSKEQRALVCDNLIGALMSSYMDPFIPQPYVEKVFFGTQLRQVFGLGEQYDFDIFRRSISGKLT